MKKKDLAHFLETVDSKKMVRVLSWVVASAAAFLAAAYFAYFQEFHGGFSAKQETWGQFGTSSGAPSIRCSAFSHYWHLSSQLYFRRDSLRTVEKN